MKLRLQGLPNGEMASALLREMTGLNAVLGITLNNASGPAATYDIELSGGLVDPADLVGKGVVAALNRKFGKTCLNVGTSSGSEVSVNFEPTCNTPETLARIDNLPAAALLAAPAPRREAVIRNPETLKKISI